MKVCTKCFTEAPESTRFCPNCGAALPQPKPRKNDRHGLIGKTVAGKFLVHDIIGEGAMGSIYRAEQIPLGKQVCIKVLHPHLTGDEELSKRFLREAKAASRLHHPNAINIIDFGSTTITDHVPSTGSNIPGLGSQPSRTPASETKTVSRNIFYIAMDFLQGKDLAHLLRAEFPLDPLRIIHIVDQICSALDEAHAQNIIHRDLKPENIMIEDRRHAKDFVTVLDFGIAKILDPDSGSGDTFHTRAGIVCGTPEYMSPEQAQGQELDARTDIYSLGVILYQLNTGKLPFTAETPIGVVTKHLTQSPPKPREVNPDISQPMEDLILRLMSKNRNNRPSSCVEVQQLLTHLKPYYDQKMALERTADVPTVAAGAQVSSSAQSVTAATAATAPTAQDTSHNPPALTPVPDENDGFKTVHSHKAVDDDSTLDPDAGLQPRSNKSVYVFVALGVVVLLGIVSYFLYPYVFPPSESIPVTQQVAQPTLPPDDQTALTPSDQQLLQESRAALHQAELQRLEEEKRNIELLEQEKKKQQELEAVRQLEAERTAVRVDLTGIRDKYKSLDYYPLTTYKNAYTKGGQPDKVSRIDALLKSASEGKTRVEAMIASLDKKELDQKFKEAVAAEHNAVDVIFAQAESIVKEPIPVVSSQDNSELVKDISLKIDTNRQMVQSSLTSLDTKRKEWELVKNSKKTAEITALQDKLRQADTELQNIRNSLNSSNVSKSLIDLGALQARITPLADSARILVEEQIPVPANPVIKQNNTPNNQTNNTSKNNNQTNQTNNNTTTNNNQGTQNSNSEQSADKGAEARRLEKLGDEQISVGNYQKAIMYYKESLKITGSPHLYKKIGQAYNSDNRTKEGSEWLRKYLKAMDGKLTPSQIQAIERQIVN